MSKEKHANFNMEDLLASHHRQRQKKKRIQKSIQKDYATNSKQ